MSNDCHCQQYKQWQWRLCTNIENSITTLYYQYSPKVRVMTLSVGYSPKTSNDTTMYKRTFFSYLKLFTPGEKRTYIHLLIHSKKYNSLTDYQTTTLVTHRLKDIQLSFSFKYNTWKPKPQIEIDSPHKRIDKQTDGQTNTCSPMHNLTHILTKSLTEVTVIA